MSLKQLVYTAVSLVNEKKHDPGLGLDFLVLGANFHEHNSELAETTRINKAKCVLFRLWLEHRYSQQNS